VRARRALTQHPGADAARAQPAAGTENKFDEQMGNDAGLFAGGEYDEDDREADAVWLAVDEHMDSRRRERREARLREQIEQYRASNPKITEQFADLKRKLATVSDAEWDAIPEIGDTTVKARKRLQSFVPAPDTLLAAAAAEKVLSAVAADGGGGGGGDGGGTDLTAVGEGRGTMLALKLERLSDSVSGQTVVDPRGYLTDLKGLRTATDAEVSDIKKARLLLKSVISTNPGHAPGWIAAARLEEVAGRLGAARALAARGAEACPSSEDAWLEAARLQTPDAAKAVLARGVAALPHSVTLWLAAAALEAESERRARVLRKALEAVPTSVRLWKALVELSAEDDARVLLSRAVECCPQHVELWLALARLESYDAARRVLNKARETLPAEAAIWVCAAKLEEAHGNGAACARILERGVKSLAAHGCVIDRDAWLRDAEAAELGDPPAPQTAAGIVAATVGAGVEEADRKRTWLADAEEAAKRGAVATARAIFEHALAAFPAKKGVWLAAARLEAERGTRDSLEALLRRAVAYCPRAEVLWLMGAKAAWRAGDVAGARAILEGAFAANPDSEDILLAAFKLEFESGERERARRIAARARDAVRSARVWQKSAQVEREEGDAAAEARLLDDGLARFPDAHKLWLMRAQLEERLGNADGARAVYARALRACAACAPLWCAAAALEERGGNLPRARALLEAGRLKLPRCDDLWLAAVRAEARAGQAKAADALLARALQECPASGALWAEAVALAPRAARKAVSVDALRRCDADPAVVACVAGLFAADRKTDKARAWYNRAVALAPDVGDHWARFAAFEAQHGGEADVVARCVAAAPRHGETWTRVAKQPENARDATADLLRKVVLALERDPAPP
jgi:pre-mRNA-processing factor 6